MLIHIYAYALAHFNISNYSADIRRFVELFGLITLHFLSSANPVALSYVKSYVIVLSIGRRSANVFGVVLTCKQVNVESESGVNRCKSTWCRARENGSLNRRSDEGCRSASKSGSKLSRIAMPTMNTPIPNVRFPLIACWVETTWHAGRRIRQCGRASSVRYFGTVPGGILDAFSWRLRSRNLP